MLSRGIRPAVGRRWLDLAMIGSVVVIWGLNWPVMKASVAIVPPAWFTALRYLIGALVLAGVLVAMGRLRLPHRRDLPVILSVGLLQMLVFTLLATAALQTLPPGRAIVLAYTMPLWVVPTAFVVFGEEIRPRRAVAGALGFAGILVLINVGELGRGGVAALLPYAMLLGASLAWAVCMVHIRSHGWIASALDLAPWQMGLEAACLVPFALVTEGAPRLSWIVETWESLLFIGIVATAFCSWAIVDVGRRIGAGAASIAMTGVPVVGLATSLAVGQEVPTLGLLVGTAAILTSIGLVAWDRRT